jgi:KDO2-lipid IV(A) lauroyltransferase
MADVKPRFVHRIQYAIGRSVLALLGAMSFDTARRVGRGLGRLAHTPFGVRRKVVERQIAGAFPEKDAGQVDALSRDAFSHFGEVIIETALLPRLGRQGILDLFEGSEGFEGILDAQAAGKGIILITGHFGNWELAGAYVAARGVPIEVIVRRMNVVR